jgi:release factor glutamine methyltransferase
VTTWRAARVEVRRRLADAGFESAEPEARFLVEQASGFDATEWVDAADVEAPARAEARLWSMLERRLQGEPLQYVLGAWGFRGFDLMVDRRVLIPRPETEFVVDVALETAVALGLQRSRRHVLAIDGRRPATVVADLGTGSGAIAIALEAELPDVEVWATDVSDDALDVARANLAGADATRVRLAAGSWFDALPASLQGELVLVVSNPPYIAEAEVPDLPPEVADYEPRHALVAGPSGLEAIEHLLEHARTWLAPRAAFVCELAPHQAEGAAARALELGYASAVVRDDLTGRRRVLVARTEEPSAQ